MNSGSFSPSIPLFLTVFASSLGSAIRRIKYAIGDSMLAWATSGRVLSDHGDQRQH